MMRKKAQVLIIFLWILAVFVVLVISATARATATFKFARYQKDGQRALYLAKAGLRRATYELDADTNGYDALSEAWADKKEIFSGIVLNDAENESAEVSFVDPESNETVFGVIDEERKININTASERLLSMLLEECDIEQPASVAKNILVWRQEGSVDESGAYEALGYAPKRAKFTNSEELMLVAGIAPEDYLKIKKFITVYTQGKININTVSPQVLLMVCDAIAEELGVSSDFSSGLVESIIIARQSRGYFTNQGDIPEPSIDEQRNILARLAQDITFGSRIFFIEVKGKVGRIEKKVVSVYDRDPQARKFLYWHEN